MCCGIKKASKPIQIDWTNVNGVLGTALALGIKSVVPVHHQVFETIILDHGDLPPAQLELQIENETRAV